MGRDDYITKAQRLAAQGEGDAPSQGQRAVAWALLALEHTLNRLLEELNHPVIVAGSKDGS
ncbi:MAG: hypothetical protein ABIJ75_10615 [Actinomycetota bacterium]